MKPEFSASLMCMNFLNIKEQVEILNSKMSMYHADIMDGHYCKNITLSPDLIKTISGVATLPIDVHLMTTNPIDWIELCAKAGAAYISPHAETINTDAFRIMNMIRNAGCGTGVVLNPGTPLSYVEPYLARIEILTIMTVDAGFAGQPFIEEMLDKIKSAVRLREEKGFTYKIQVDGSCNRKTFRRLKEAGSDIYILGASGLFGLDIDLSAACDKAYQDFEEAVK